MKRTNNLTLREAITEFLNAYRLDEKMVEEKVIQSWGKVVGKLVKNHTTELYIKNKKLYVKLDSAAIRNELSYSREKICTALNKEVKAEAIKDVIIR